jgi:hypothetical protein
MKALGIFSATHEEVGQIIVADINMDVIRPLVDGDSAAREKLITRG